MRFLFLQSAFLVAAAALRPTPSISGRRAALGSFAAGAIAFVPRPSHADQLSEGGALGATCLGFGCNPYGRPDFNGLEDAPENSMPYPDFLKAIKDKKVEGVVFQGNYRHQETERSLFGCQVNYRHQETERSSSGWR